MTILKFWFIAGFIGAIILSILPINKPKNDQKQPEQGGLKDFLMYVLAGFITLLWALGAIQQIVASSNPSAGKYISYIYILVLVSGFLTECSAPREGAHCNDGTYSYATGRGACSWHGGVDSWDKDYWWEH